MRSRHVVEGFLLPGWTRLVKKFVDAMSRRTLQALEDLGLWKDPPIFPSHGGKRR